MKCLSLLLLCLMFGCPACGQAQPPLVVILLPGTSLQDWRTAQAPNLHHLMATGALAVMNTRTARLPNDHRRETPESAVLTLGAGARAAGSRRALDFLPLSTPIFGTGATADELYERRVGQMPRAGRDVNVHWPAVLRANAGLGYDLRLGDLADALAARQVLLASGGGLADGVAAASDGTISRQSSLTVQNGQCLIWDAGSNVTDADPVIGEAARQAVKRHGRLIVLSPFAGDGDYAQGRRLTPVLEWGEGIPIGLLASPSTRRPGLVTNTDFAPRVAGYFGLKREAFPELPFGYAWKAIPVSHSEHRVSVLEESAYRQAQGMKILPFAAVALALWMLLGTALACRGKLPYGLAWGPLIVMFALLMSRTAADAAIYGVAFTLLCALLSLRYTNNFFLLLLPALIVFPLMLDMAMGGPLMRNVLLGYSAVEGARYYGIGNEAMGLLIGSALVLAARLWPMDKPSRIVTLIFLTTIVLLLGAPGAGAKAGGLLVSVAAFGTFLWGASGRKWSGRVALALLALTIGVMGVIAVGDALFLRGPHSHIGEAARRIQSGGVMEAWDIITRKLAVESRLAYHSAWACPLWGGLLSLGLLWSNSVALTREERALRTGGIVAVAGCILFNDAGIVAGALCLVPIWCDAAIGLTNKKPLEPRTRFQGQPSSGNVY